MPIILFILVLIANITGVAVGFNYDFAWLVGLASAGLFCCGVLIGFGVSLLIIAP